MVDVLLTMLILTSTYVIISIATELLIGHTGLMTLWVGALVGVGAYAAGILSLRFGVPYPLALLAAMAITALIGVVISLPTLPLRHEYFLIGSLATQVVVGAVLVNLTDLTGGAGGMSGITRPAILNSMTAYAAWGLVLVVLVWYLARRIERSTMGLALRAVREDEVAAESVGVSVPRAKLAVTLVSSAFMALAGAHLAFFLTALDPSSFRLDMTIMAMTMVVVGGSGSLRGAVLGAVLITLLPHLIELLPIRSENFGLVNNLVYGALLVLFMLFRPRGIWPQRAEH